MTPSEEVTLGEDVTIRCWDQHEDMTLLLFKDRKRTRLQPQPQVSFGKVAEFHICSVTKEKEGKYSCYYQSKSYQEVWSHPSNSVNLVVEGEGSSMVSQPETQGPIRLMSWMLRTTLCPKPWDIVEGMSGWEASSEAEEISSVRWKQKLVKFQWGEVGAEVCLKRIFPWMLLLR